MNQLRRATLGWWWAVLAPNTLTKVIASALLAVMGVSLALHHLFWEWWANRLYDYSGALETFAGSSAGLAFYYGLMRGLGFHPALDHRYHDWLRASPWTPGAPLPKGPITPVWQDALLLCLLTLTLFFYGPHLKHAEVVVMLPALGMSAGLTLAWTAANLVTRNLLAVYAALLTLPVVWLAASTAPAAVSVTLGLIAAATVAYTGVVRGMAGYPWEVFPRDKNYLKRLFNPREERSVGWQAMATVGWPYTHLLQPPKDFRVPRLRAALEAMTVAAWIACAGVVIPAKNNGEILWVLVGQFGFGLMVARFVFNTPLMCPKLCLGERIVRRRPIVWRHDRLLIEPLLLGGTVSGIAWAWNTWMRSEPGWLGAALAAAVGVWLFRRIGRPADERFYTGAQSIAGVNLQGGFFKKLAAPGD